MSNPGLAPLADYGGATQTFALLPGSPAIDAGAASISGVTIPTTDQRGLGRVGNVDIGAFESQGFTLAVASGSTPQSAYVNATFANPLVVTVTANNGSEPVDGGVVTFLAPGSGPSATLSATTATIAAGATSVTAMANGTAGGPYTVTASAAGAGQVGFALTNLSRFVQPVFSNLAAPTITYGTSTVTLSGTIAAGSSIPTGSVAITVGGMTAPATIGGDGSFSAVFDTHALVVAGSPYTVSYDFAASGNFLGCSGTSSLTITPATLDVSVSAVNISYGTALVDTQLSGSASEAGTPVAGTFAYDPSVVGTVLHANVAPQSEPVIFTPTDTTDYNSVTATASINVSKAILSIGTVYDSLTYGTTLGYAINPTTVQVQDAHGHAVAGTFDFVESGVGDVTAIPLDVGHYDLSVTFNPTDTTDYSSATTTASIDITQAKIVIVADSPTITYGDSPTLTNTLYTDLGPDPNNSGQDDYQELGPTDLASVAYTNALGGAPAATTDATLSAGDHTINPTDISTLSPTTARSEFLNDFDVVYGTGMLTVTPATLTVTGITASDKVYDSTTTATLNADGAALVGVVSGDSVTLNTGGAAGIFASKDAGTNIMVQVSGLTISGSQAGDYTLTQPTTSANITPAALTISAVSDTKVYDGTLTSSETPAVGTLYGTDTVTGLVQAFQSKDVLGAGGSTLQVTGYQVNDGNGGADYTVTLQTATGTITPAALTISAVSDTKVYDGTLTSSETPAVGTLYGTDTVTGLAQAFQSKDVLGAGGSTLQVTGYQVNDGNGGADYTVTLQTATGTITPAALTISAVSDTKGYDGTLTSSETPAVGTLYGTDTVTGLVQAFQSKDVLGAGGSTLQVTGYQVNDGNGGADYTVTLQTATGTITPAALTISAVSDTKVYDGTLTSSETPVVGTLYGTDTVTGLVQAFQSKDVLGAGGSTLQVTGYQVNDGNSGADYTVTLQTATGTITPAALTISAVSDTKVYDGTLTSSETPVVGTLYGTDTVTGLVQAFQSKDVLGAGGSTLQVTGYQVNDGNSGADYTVTLQTATGTITPAALTISAVSDTKVYDGTLTSSETPVVGTLYGTDTVTGLVQAFQSKDVLGAGGSTLQVTGYQVNDGNSGADYTVTLQTATGTITPAALTISAVSDTKVYDGTLTSSETPVVGTLYGTDTVTGLVQAFQSKDVLGVGGSTLQVTGYQVNDGNGGADYTVTLLPAAGTITPATLIVTANNTTMVLGGPVPTFSAYYIGLVNGDTVSSLGNLNLSFTPGSTTVAGTSTITLSGSPTSSDSDYTIVYDPGTLTVNTPTTPIIVGLPPSKKLS